MKRNHLRLLCVGMLALALACLWFMLSFQKSELANGQSVSVMQETKTRQLPVKVALLDGVVSAPLPYPLVTRLDFSGSQSVKLEGKSLTISEQHGSAVARLFLKTLGKSLDSHNRLALYSLQVLDQDGYADPQDVARAIDWCVRQRIDVINISAGFRKDDERLRKAVANALKHRIVLVAAAGNTYGGRADYPAAYEGVYSVAASDEVGKLANYSASKRVDVRAPGEYENLRGTSFAAVFASALLTRELLRTNDEMINSVFLQLKINQHLRERNQA